jgi:hypothetical protein
MANSQLRTAEQAVEKAMETLHAENRHAVKPKMMHYEGCL